MPFAKHDEFNEALDENKKEKQATYSTLQHQSKGSSATKWRNEQNVFYSPFIVIPIQKILYEKGLWTKKSYPNRSYDWLY